MVAATARSETLCTAKRKIYVAASGASVEQLQQAADSTGEAKTQSEDSHTDARGSLSWGSCMQRKPPALDSRFAHEASLLP